VRVPLVACRDHLRRDLRGAAQRDRAARARSPARDVMADAIPIVDAWTQHISGTPPGTNPEGENVFRNYGMLEVFHHGTDLAKMIDAMDRAGVRTALMAGDNGAVAKAQERPPVRIFGHQQPSPAHSIAGVHR